MMSGLLTYVGRSLLRGHLAADLPDPPKVSNELLIGLSVGLCLGIACAHMKNELSKEPVPQ